MTEPAVHPVDDLAGLVDDVTGARALAESVANHLIYRVHDDPVDVEAAVELWLQLLVTAKDLADAVDHIYRAAGNLLCRSSFGDGHKPGRDQDWTDGRQPGRTFRVTAPSVRRTIDVPAVRSFLAERVADALTDGEGPDELVDRVLTCVTLTPSGGLKTGGIKELGGDPQNYVTFNGGEGPWRVTCTAPDPLTIDGGE